MKNFSLTILSFSLFISLNHAQINDSASVTLTAVQIGNVKVERADWQNITFKKNLSLHISFESSGKGSSRIYYKVLLDGKILSTNLFDNFISLKDLNPGFHLLKIIPSASSNGVAVPLLIPFTVTDELFSMTDKSPDEEINLFTSPVIIYALSGLVLIQFAVIIFLFSKRISKSTHKKEKELKNAKANTRTMEELVSLKQSLTRLKDELKQERDGNEYLQKQLKEVNTNVQDLEKANIHLVEQKSKLEASKYKLELLHTQKEEMFAIAVHDIKNPASAIRGYIELLNSYDLNATEQQEVMVSLVSSSEDIVKLSQDMCSIIARAMPEPKLNFSKQSINTIVETVLNQNASYSKAKKVKLVKKVTDNLPEISFDSEKIEEALDNLVNNAIKFAPPDTLVELLTYIKDEKKKTIVVEVKDNGVGLTEDDLRKSFQKGSMLSAKPTGFEQSSGLGLWIVKKIVDEHNGIVWVESKLNEGSRFAFELPLDEQ